MPFTVKQAVLGADNQSGATISITVSATTAGNTIFGGVAYTSGSTLTPTISSTHDTYTIQTNTLDSGNGNCFLTFAKVNITGGDTSISVAWGSTISFVRIEIQEVSGGITAIDKKTAQLQSGPGTTNSSGNVTPAQTGDYLYGACYASAGNAGVTYSASGSYTIQNNAANTDTNNIADEEQTDAASVAIAATFTNTVGTTNYITAIIAGTPPAAGLVPYDPWPQWAPVLAQ